MSRKSLKRLRYVIFCQILERSEFGVEAQGPWGLGAHIIFIQKKSQKLIRAID